MQIDPSTDLVIMPMQLSHLEPLMRLHREVYPRSLQESRDMFINIIKAKSSICLIGAVNGKLVGYALGYPSAENRNDYDLGPDVINSTEKAVFLHDLCINPKMRVDKFSREMLAVFIEKVKEACYRKVITISIAGSFPFWSSQGFENMREFDYKGRHSFYMELDLEKPEPAPLLLP